MTDAEMSKCRKIIHGHAVAAAAGNLVPIPGVGLATDTVTMTTMAMALAAVFGGSITESVAKNMAVNAIVATIKKQPVRIIAKEISKVVPFVGQLVAPSISVAMLESAGWILANELAEERRPPATLPPSEPETIDLQPASGHNFKYDIPFREPDELPTPKKSDN